MRWPRAFGAFWYDFLVGDRPELFVGPIVVLIVTGMLIAAGLGSTAAAVIFVAGVVLVGAASLGLQVRGRR